MHDWRAPDHEAREVDPVAGVVIEPMVQGAAGIKLWSPGTLTAVRNWFDRSGALPIADEVLTGFERTGICSPVSTNV